MCNFLNLDNIHLCLISLLAFQYVCVSIYLMVDWFSFIEPAGSFSSANQIPVPGLFEFLPFAIFSISVQSVVEDSTGLYFWFTMFSNTLNLVAVSLGLRVVMNITATQLYNGEYVVNKALGVTRVSYSSYNATSEFEILRLSYVVVATATSIILLCTILSFVSYFCTSINCSIIKRKKKETNTDRKKAKKDKPNTSYTRTCNKITCCVQPDKNIFINSGNKQEWLVEHDDHDSLGCLTTFWWIWGLILLVGVILPHLLIIIISASLSIPLWTTRDSPHFYTLTGLCMMYLFPPVGHAFHKYEEQINIISHASGDISHDHCKPSWWFGYIMFVFGLVFSYMNTILDYVTIVHEEHNPFTVDGFMNAVTCSIENSTTGPGFAFECGGSDSETSLFKYRFAALSIGYQTTSLLFMTVCTITFIVATVMNYYHLTAPVTDQYDL